MANTLKKPTVFTGPGTYREAPTNVQIAILKENYPENKLSEELILAEITGGIANNIKERLPCIRSYRLHGGKGSLIYAWAD
jgi:hypothetical protein